jgi:hypothetical protein
MVEDQSMSKSADCAEYRALLERVTDGTLRITFINGLPRGGTTAFERLCYEGLPVKFDLNVNQPGLMARVPGDQVRDRQQAIWQNVLDPVIACETAAASSGRILFTDPIHVVVKETTNVVMPNADELLRWQRMCHCMILVVRNPHLQVESRILCIADRILSGAMKDDLGIDKTIDPRSFTVHGMRLIKEGTDFSHVDFDAACQGAVAGAKPTPWEQHYSWMKQTRDFRSLDLGFLHFCGLHPLFEEPTPQRIIWETYAAAHSSTDAAAETERWVGTKIEHFGELPDWMHHAMFEWRFGWTCFKSQQALLQGCDNVHVVDFSDAQACPEYLNSVLTELIFGCSHRCDKGGVEERAGDGSGEKAQPPGAAAVAAVAAVAGGGGFDVGSGRTPEWDAWFHGPCFEQHAHQSCALRAPNKSADTIEKLPAFLQEQLPDWMYVYTAARADARCIRFPEAQLCKYDGVDEVFDVVRKLARTCDVPPFVSGVSTTD